ncbi:MAG: protein jag [Clostridiales bacterium]|jgi:spoIIIJ-associated protein|nr:protein jag [Clostridiales bacterium]MDD2572359.1 protein jag [Eubacteriales bacterium]MDY0119050.1 RNA-binding cell elongation regulator Jag/EloR [Clostridia bacterium]NLG29635.1 protein jag [Clostridiaceae bacterium]MCK9349851.1 protein jag [Clostridiales bacterium]
MERTIETTGKTVEQAIQEALEELGVKEDLALIEVLDEGETGGLLGFGRRPARVRVSVDDNKVQVSEKASELKRKTVAEEDESGWKVALDDRGFVPAENAALDYIEAIFSGIGIHGRIESYMGEDESLHIDVLGSDCGVAIGRHGETLEAIQYLTNIVANRWVDDHLRVVVDVAGYRSRREQRLRQQAKKTAERVLDTGRESRLKPMSPAERRIVHLSLRETEGITTYSEGTEPRRYVVISPTAGLEIIG